MQKKKHRKDDTESLFQSGAIFTYYHKCMISWYLSDKRYLGKYWNKYYNIDI